MSWWNVLHFVSNCRRCTIQVCDCELDAPSASAGEVFPWNLHGCIQTQGRDKGDRHINSWCALLHLRPSASGCNHSEHTGSSISRTPRSSANKFRINVSIGCEHEGHWRIFTWQAEQTLWPLWHCKIHATTSNLQVRIKALWQRNYLFSLSKNYLD